MVIEKIVKDKIALLTINREEALNAMNTLILNGQRVHRTKL